MILAAGPMLVTSRTIIDILVSSPPPSLPSTSRDTVHPSAQIAATMIAVLCDLVESTSGEVQAAEDFQPVLYGCLDIIEAKGGEDEPDRVLRELAGHASRVGPDRASFVLSVGEQLVTRISASTLRDTLLPLMQR